VFVNQDHCQVCFDYGDLLLCQHCPAAYHLKCCGMRKVPSGQWSCPHHQGCVTCLRSCGAIGFTFRCEACANSFCEDCVPPDVEFLEHVERWEALGFKYPRNCCYIRCVCMYVCIHARMHVYYCAGLCRSTGMLCGGVVVCM
jgi:SWI/SNF-related matrix-associated actin-dependent regulator of chromatin subfamily A member 5